ncbi:hypothetical protein [Photobacterium leiognathi]|uniref:hypothetical protein n=1 Tax=Photobacterium leiognathi TaxID=553611 RepID=UPI00298299CE|nr:hypothetical protein [Photobacterium leiognathi]
MKIAALFCSEWDSGTVITSNCSLDLKALSVVTCESVDADGLDLCHREYIQVELNGTMYDLEADQGELTAIGKKQFESAIGNSHEPPAQFITEIEITDPDSQAPVQVAIYKHPNGGLFGLDSSYIEQHEVTTISDPFADLAIDKLKLSE